MVTPIHDGVLVKRDISVRMKLAEWRVALTMDYPSPDMVKAVKSEVQLFRRLLTTIPPGLSRVARKTYWLREVDRAQSRIDALSPRRVRIVGFPWRHWQ